MTDIAMNYVVNPFNGFMKGVYRTFEVAGYARAAAELTRLGYHAEAKNCILQIAKIKASK